MLIAMTTAGCEPSSSNLVRFRDILAGHAGSCGDMRGHNTMAPPFPYPLFYSNSPSFVPPSQVTTSTAESRSRVPAVRNARDVGGDSLYETWAFLTGEPGALRVPESNPTYNNEISPEANREANPEVHMCRDKNGKCASHITIDSILRARRSFTHLSGDEKNHAVNQMMRESVHKEDSRVKKNLAIYTTQRPFVLF